MKHQKMYHRGEPNILAKTFGDFGKFSDIGTFGDIGTELKILSKKRVSV
jgi:hypothetical protein